MDSEAEEGCVGCGCILFRVLIAIVVLLVIYGLLVIVFRQGFGVELPTEWVQEWYRWVQDLIRENPPLQE